MDRHAATCWGSGVSSGKPARLRRCLPVRSSLGSADCEHLQSVQPFVVAKLAETARWGTRFPRFPRQAGWNYSRGPSRSARRSKQSHGSSACGYKVPSETRTESDDMTAAGMAAVCAGEPAPSPSRPQAFQAARCIGLGMTAHRPDARHPLADMATPSRPVRWSSCGAPQPVTTAGRPSGPRAGGRQTDAWRSSLTPTAGTIHVCPDTRSAADACIRFSADEA